MGWYIECRPVACENAGKRDQGKRQKEWSDVLGGEPGAEAEERPPVVVSRLRRTLRRISRHRALCSPVGRPGNLGGSDPWEDAESWQHSGILAASASSSWKVVRTFSFIQRDHRWRLSQP